MRLIDDLDIWLQGT